MDVHLTFSRGLYMVYKVISYVGCICSLFFQLIPLFEISEGIKLQELCACVHWELQHCKVCIPTQTDALSTVLPRFSLCAFSQWCKRSTAVRKGVAAQWKGHLNRCCWGGSPWTFCACCFRRSRLEYALSHWEHWNDFNLGPVFCNLGHVCTYTL